MKRVLAGALIILMALTLCACGSTSGSEPSSEPPTWQEQYDLGIRYLSEGSYQEAIIAFTAAIEIDPKRIEAYNGLADSYLGLGEYEKAVSVWTQATNAVEGTDLLSEIDKQSQMYATAAEFLSQGDAGVQILDLAFDKERFLSGEETEFTLTVAYSAPGESACQMNISTNSTSPYSFDAHERFQTAGGVGVQKVSVSIAPVLWENYYFGLSASMWGQKTGERIGTSTWYITPEGEISDHYAPRNQYGGTIFEARRGAYREFGSFTAEEQNFIRSMVSAAIVEDIETMKSLLGFELDQYYTIWNGYKIQITSTGKSSTDDGDRSVLAEIEIRPENGMGYYYSIHLIDAVASRSEEYWSDAVFLEQISCPCENWQWNGTRTYINSYYHYYQDKDGVTCNTTEITTTTGMMVNSLREGVFSAERHTVSIWNKWPDNNEDFWTTVPNRTYNEGMLIEEDGQAVEETTIYTIAEMGYGGSLLDQWLLDDLYW